MTKPYTLVHQSTGTNITKHVISLDKFLDADVLYTKNSAQIMLSTKTGRFITQSYDGVTPLLQHLDEFKLSITKSGNTYSRILFLDTELPQESKTGNQMQVELFGRERHLEKIIIPGHWFFISVKLLMRIIIAYYNAKRGTAQPELIYQIDDEDYLDFPEFPVGTFDFGDGIDLLSAIRQLIAWLQLPVPAQGAGDLFSLIFEDHPTDNSKLVIKIFSQGSITSTPDTITAHTKQIKITRTFEQYAANIKVIRGQAESATMPPQITQWTSRIEEYDNFPVYRNDIAYKAGFHTNWNGVVYRCIVDTTPGTTPVSVFNWNVVTKSEYVGTGFQYSPFTKEKASVIRNYTMNQGGDLEEDLGSPAFVDSNLIIRDSTTWQDECIMRIKSLDDIPSQYLYSGDGDASDKVYEGMKFIIDSTLGTIETPFTGNDKYGKAYADALVQMDRDGDWIVEKTPEREDYIAIRSESKMYQYQKVFPAHAFSENRRAGTATPEQLAWRDISESPRSNHCFHYPNSIENVDGLVTPLPGGTQHQNSAVKIEYVFNNSDAFKTVFDAIFQGTSLTEIIETQVQQILWSKDLYNLGWWATLFEAPNPPATYYGITESVGELFGGDITSKVPILDANNLNYTPTGKQGYDEVDSNYLGPLSGIRFRLNFDVLLGDQRRQFVGDIPFRCTIYDTEGNVWIRDIIYRLLGDSQDIVMFFSEFQIYRSRAPLGVIPTLENIRLSELLTLEIFEQRKIKRITLQMQEVYDEHGRHDPTGYFKWWENYFVNFLIYDVKHVGIIDAFGFIRTPIAIKKGTQADTHHIMDKINDFPNVSNVEQLDKIADAQLDLSLHKNDAYIITSPISLDKKPGEAFYLKHKYMVETSEKTELGSAIPNTKDLSIVEVNYIDNKDQGTIRQLKTIKRI